MRVLLVSQYYAPEIGATQNRMSSFVDALLAGGHQVSVICEQPNHPHGVFAPGFGRRPLMRERSGRLTVYRLWVCASPRKSPLRRMLFYGSFAAGASLLATALRRHDVVVTSSPPLPGASAAVLAGRLRRVPVVLDIRDVWPAAAEALGELSNPRLIAAFEQLERWMYRTSMATTTTTRSFCRHIETVSCTTRPMHLPNGALDELVALPARQPPPAPPFRVGYVGNFGIAQGLGIMLDAATRMREEDVVWELVGGGPLHDELERQLADRQLQKVRIRRPVSPTAVGALLQSFHALVIPLGRHPLLGDFIPSKLYDAMAAGRPTIVAANGEAKRFVTEHGVGLTVSPEDGAALAAAVRRLADDPALAAQLASTAKAVAVEFGRGRQARRMCQLVEDVGGGRDLRGRSYHLTASAARGVHRVVRRTSIPRLWSLCAHVKQRLRGPAGHPRGPAARRVAETDVSSSTADRALSLHVRLLVGLFRRFPPRSTIFRDPDPRPVEEYEDERQFAFDRYFGVGDLFAGKDVLDLGSGYGGRPVAYRERGASSVVGLEVDSVMVETATRFAAQRGVSDVRFTLGTGEMLPFADRSFDLITMNDVMEHVVDPARVLSECHRVLRDGGRLALLFPPYYDVTAGSHLHGYAGRVPALNALFSTRALRAAAEIVLDERHGNDWHAVMREVPTDKLWNLNGLTAAGFRRLVRQSPLKPIRVRYLGHLDHRVSSHTGRALAMRLPAYMIGELVAQVPLLQELCCARVSSVLERSNT